MPAATLPSANKIDMTLTVLGYVRSKLTDRETAPKSGAEGAPEAFDKRSFARTQIAVKQPNFVLWVVFKDLLGQSLGLTRVFSLPFHSEIWYH